MRAAGLTNQHLVKAIERENAPSEAHKAALFAMAATLSELSFGRITGRYAVGAPTGTGKTTAILAHVQALHELGLLDQTTGLLVTQEKVESLDLLRRDLIGNRGVPPDLIGWAHSKEEDQSLDPPTPQDEWENRPVLLVTHARIKMSSSFKSCLHYQGRPRAAIYDESLIVTEAFGVDLRALQTEAATLEAYGREYGREGILEAHGYVAQVTEAAEAALKELISLRGDHALIEPPKVEATRARRWIDELKHVKGNTADSRTLLDGCQQPLRVLRTADGGAIIQHRRVVPDVLETILVLDASYRARKLCQLDPRLHDAEEALGSFRALPKRLNELKRWDEVTFHHMLQGGGRSSIAEHYKGRSGGWVSAAVAAAIKEADPGPILIFTFKKRVDAEGRSLTEKLQQDLRRLGLDLDEEALTDDGERVPRFYWETWGRHDSTNDYRHCRTVIMLGVLQRNPKDLYAQALGQIDPGPGGVAEAQLDVTAQELVQSEAAHVVFQGASRARCRQVDEHGQALATDVYLIHKSTEIREHLRRVMPGAKWVKWVPEDRPAPHKKLTRTDFAEALLVSELTIYGPSRLEPGAKLSSKELRRLAGLEEWSNDVYRAAMRRTLNRVEGVWRKEGRSLVRCGPAPASTGPTEAD